MKTYFTVSRFSDKQLLSSFKEDDTTILSEIQLDYNTIIMSPGFRRMQDKTQVFPLSKGDYVRTRLTHSYEVSIIAEQIAKYAIIYLDRHQKESSYAAWTPTDKNRFVDLSKTVGLIHDIGNPPFGHFGEDCIRNWFDENQRRVLYVTDTGEKVRLRNYINQSSKDYPLYEDFLNFDGNVQGFRVVLKSHPSINGNGLNVVKSLAHAMVKYPIDSQTALENHAKKFGFNYAERDLFASIHEATQTINPRHLVTYILEAADDIAYRTADIEDALSKNVITLFDIKAYLKKYLDLNIKNDQTIYDSFNSFFESSIESDTQAIDNVRNWLSHVRLNLMKSVARQFAEDFEILESHHIANYELTELCYAHNFFTFAKTLTQDKIYDNHQVLDLEVSAKACMYDLLDVLIDAVIAYDSDIPQLKPTYYQSKIIKLIGDDVMDVYHNEKETDDAYNLYLRILCVLDYVSSMTDRFAHEKRSILVGKTV